MADDVSRRRERRRRNILENSEIRLKRLLGENVRLKDIEVPPLTKNISEIFISDTNDDELPDKGELSTREFSSPSLNIYKHGAEQEEEEEKVEESDSVDISTASEYHAFSSPCCMPEASFETESVQTYFKDPPSEGINIGKKSTAEVTISPVWVYYPVIKKLSYAAFAMVLHLLLFFDVLHVLIGRSIFIPFISLETAFFTFEALIVPAAALTNFRVSHGLLNGALLLSGVPQRFIIVLSKVFSFIERLWEEFSIYLFTFLIMHWFFEVKAD